jgi:hypothetical protein
MLGVQRQSSNCSTCLLPGLQFFCPVPKQSVCIDQFPRFLQPGISWADCGCSCHRSRQGFRPTVPAMRALRAAGRLNGRGRNLFWEEVGVGLAGSQAVRIGGGPLSTDQQRCILATCRPLYTSVRRPKAQLRTVWHRHSRSQVGMMREGRGGGAGGAGGAPRRLGVSSFQLSNLAWRASVHQRHQPFSITTGGSGVGQQGVAALHTGRCAA